MLFSDKCLFVPCCSVNTHEITTWIEQAAFARDGKSNELKALQDRFKCGKE